MKTRYLFNQLNKIAYTGLMFIFILTVTINTNAQTYRVFKGDTINRTDAKGMKQSVWRRYYDNDQLFSETWFKNGKPYNDTKTYYKSGEPQAVLKYRSGGTIGNIETFRTDGGIKANMIGNINL